MKAPKNPEDNGKLQDELEAEERVSFDSFEEVIEAQFKSDDETFEVAEAFREPDIDILRTNPFLNPLGIAKKYDTEACPADQYDTLVKKIQLRNEFVASRIPFDIRNRIENRLNGYWTGSKLAQFNPHYQFPKESFSEGSSHLLHDIHLVIICDWGDSAYADVYRGMPLSQKVVSYPGFGCSGTFLGNEEAIRGYFKNEPIPWAIKQDMEIPIERPWRGERCIEFLTHTALDIRDESIFLVIENAQGDYTRLVREHFPHNQVITVISGISFSEDDLSTIFSATKVGLEERQLLFTKSQYENKGFYHGETYFLADLSRYYLGVKGLETGGMIFGLMTLLAKFGADYSGVVWGSSGGAEGAMKAARALYGASGARSPADLRRAVEWADKLRKK